LLSPLYLHGPSNSHHVEKVILPRKGFSFLVMTFILASFISV
jgi:hypothetical protein